jgi:hypothetical protein
MKFWELARGTLVIPVCFAALSAHAAEIYSGYYTPEIPDSYYNAMIFAEHNAQGDVVAITERFDVEGIPSIPFKFTCEGTKCVNTEKPNWVIRILSHQKYEDAYNNLITVYNFAAPTDSD